MTKQEDALYEETLNFLFQQLPMFTRIGAAAYKPDLATTLTLAKACGDPHLEFKSIHIAGTNGKGSCSSLISTAFRKSGHRTGLYTSPHINDFRERIRVDGAMISKKYVIDFVARNRKLIDELKPSFFELTVVMAYAYFAEQHVDIAVIETGLGGLLDSTNIVIPEVSVITNISNDHAYLLGNTLSEIAIQKAGIIKQGVPVVIGETQPAVQKVFLTKALLAHSSIFFADNRYQAIFSKQTDEAQLIRIVDKTAMQDFEVMTDLRGLYQQKNIITALMTLDVLKSLGWKLDTLDYRTVFADAGTYSCLQGRYEIVSVQPKIIFDVSHNEAGIKALFAQVTPDTRGSLHIVTGFVRDKDLDNILRLFPKEAIYYFVQADLPRALPAGELRTVAALAGLQGEAYTSIAAAIQQALQAMNKDDTLLVTGSFFILADAYRYIEDHLH